MIDYPLPKLYTPRGHPVSSWAHCCWTILTASLCTWRPFGAVGGSVGGVGECILACVCFLQVEEEQITLVLQRLQHAPVPLLSTASPPLERSLDMQRSRLPTANNFCSQSRFPMFQRVLSSAEREKGSVFVCVDWEFIFVSFYFCLQML